MNSLMRSSDTAGASGDDRKTFLITGGGGYIGFHIGLKLVQLEKDVILFDVQFPSTVKWNIHSSIVQSSTINGKYTVTDISCPYGKLKFIQGKLSDIIMNFIIINLFIIFRGCKG